MRMGHTLFDPRTPNRQGSHGVVSSGLLLSLPHVHHAVSSEDEVVLAIGHVILSGA